MALLGIGAAMVMAMAGWARAPDAQDTIWIEVAPQDLARCQATLAHVAQVPAVADNGSALWQVRDPGLPAVACMATTL
jgi:hypothetical protein